MIPSREKAEQLLQEGLQKNPGPWGDHSKTAAHCAEKIAAACGDLDPEKAYVLGLLHDIGRTFGVRHLGHVSDGYSYMKKIGCDEVAKVCLTHSFATQTLEEYIGKYDVSEDELSLIRTELEKSVYPKSAPVSTMEERIRTTSSAGSLLCSAPEASTQIS